MWDPVRKFTRQYRRNILAAHREIDDLAQRGENRKVATPSYVQQVVVPITGIIKEKLPALGIVVNEKIEKINAKDAYYRVLVGEQTIGGFSYPGPEASHIDFTVFAHDRPWGRVFHVSKQAELLKIISELAGFLELDKQTDTDEQQ